MLQLIHIDGFIEECVALGLPLSVTRRGQILEGVLRVLVDISSVLTRCQQKFQGVELSKIWGVKNVISERF